MAEPHRTGQIRRGTGGVRAGVRWMRGARLLGAVVALFGFTAIVTAAPARASQPRTAAPQASRPRTAAPQASRPRTAAPQASRPRTVAGSAWQVETTPNVVGAGINEFSAVSCNSATACTAVGSHAASFSSPGFSLAERWNGTSWRLQRTILPNGAVSSTFTGVSCASATACIAVGATIVKATRRGVNLAEAWNGTTWRVQAIPTPQGSTDSSLFAVSCTSPTACTAVGDYDTAAGSVVAEAERWNGTAWRIQTMPRPAKVTQLFGVSCPAARACTAAGFQNAGTGDAQPLAEAWNGTTWHVQAIPLPHNAPGGALSAVSCTSPGACTATGTDFSTTAPTLAERWNGTNWRVQPTPNPPNFTTSRQEVTLNGVSCTSATACAATGQYAPGGNAAYFLEAWNGSSWRLVTAPLPAGFAQGALNGVSCVPARCTAAGAWSGGPVPIATLALAN